MVEHTGFGTGDLSIFSPTPYNHYTSEGNLLQIGNRTIGPWRIVKIFLGDHIHGTPLTACVVNHNLFDWTARPCIPFLHKTENGSIFLQGLCHVIPIMNVCIEVLKVMKQFLEAPPFSRHPSHCHCYCPPGRSRNNGGWAVHVPLSDMNYQSVSREANIPRALALV